jgi:hypothetical protein
VDPGSLGGEAYQDLTRTARGVEFKIEVMKVGLPDVLEVGSLQSQVFQDPVDLDPVE